MFVSGYFCLPIEDEDTVVITNEIDNMIDEGDIDLSGLEPQAFGIPKNESGKNHYQYQLFLLFKKKYFYNHV